ncbi:MAG TPA: hypothetical protein VNI01_07925 [Elusimicrobiota bacterium]|jgi:hypothetical protein|nr:hypothetical protein [Elusimicrobiota bacterium]
MELEKARRLAREALAEGAVDAGPATERLAVWEEEKRRLQAERETERYAWEAERAALRDSLRRLEERMGEERLAAKRDSDELQAAALALQAQREAWRLERAQDEKALELRKAALAQRETELGVRLRALEVAHQAELANLRKERDALLDRLRASK